MTELEATICNLEALVKALRESQELPQSTGGIGDKVAGIQVIGPDGTIKQEWHDD